MLNIEVRGLREVQVTLDRSLDIISDFGDMWEPFIDGLLVPRIEEVFASDGEGRWAPRRDSLPHPLLRKSLALFRSYTQQGAEGNINIQTADSLIWGSNIPYADYHEEGTSRMPARPVVGTVVNPAFEDRVASFIDDWIQGRIRQL